MTDKTIPFSLKDAPSLIEHVLPVQRLSIDVFKERMAGSGQTLTALGSYWKGRKPLVLNRACILGSLLPVTENIKKDLEIFELLMSMDEESMRKRLGLKDGVPLPASPYKELATKAKRAEEIPQIVSAHIWKEVNSHLGTSANSYPQLIEQLGVMRFGRVPIVADTFSGSGQIPFEAARLGCDVYASDLNPVACMLTWGNFHIVGASPQKFSEIQAQQKILLEKVESQIRDLQVEHNTKGWRAKVFLYCTEVICPSSGWRVPIMPSMIISKSKKVIAELIPDPQNKNYKILIHSDVSDEAMAEAEQGTITRNSKFGEAYVTHTIDGVTHRNSISSIRGEYQSNENTNELSGNKVRRWSKEEFDFRKDDIFSERLYAIQWIVDETVSRSDNFFLAVTDEDLKREEIVKSFIKNSIEEWQNAGFIPSMRIEPGAPPRYEGKSLITTRGWTHWHHLFNPRQLLISGLVKKYSNANLLPGFAQYLNWNARLSMWNPGNNNVQQVFANQALNPLYTYGCRSFHWSKQHIAPDYQNTPISSTRSIDIVNHSASELNHLSDVYITDPPYGDAVKYEEILDFFVAWLKTNPPEEFEKWTWDSRRAMAVKGEDHDFKLSMVATYKRMTENMPDNGIQIIMFTHQSGSIWADMANIVWASGLKVSAAWYIVTETDSALRDGQYVKGTILLVLRKRVDRLESFRDELAYEIKEEVENQVVLLAGLNSNVKDLYRDENLFEDADIQMAGYAAALRVLTKYSVVDGVDMPKESLRPRVKNQKTLVDDLIEFAVDIANQYLVPQGLSKSVWDDLVGSERFYLKMLDMESKGINSLSNYQNFAKAFKVLDFSSLIGDSKANKTQLKTAEIFGKRYMGSTDEFGSTNVRNVLYAIFLLMENKISSDDVLHQLKELVLDFYRKRDLLIAIADYINKKTSGIREIESQSARILRDLIRNERV